MTGTPPTDPTPATHTEDGMGPLLTLLEIIACTCRPAEDDIKEILRQRPPEATEAGLRRVLAAVKPVAVHGHRPASLDCADAAGDHRRRPQRPGPAVTGLPLVGYLRAEHGPETARLAHALGAVAQGRTAPPTPPATRPSAHRGGRMRTVVGYLRPGTPARSVPVDIDNLFARAARKQGVRLTAVYTDQPPIARASGSREGFLDALVDVRERRADGLLLLALNDLAWEPDVRTMLMRLVTSAGGTVLVSDPGPAASHGVRPRTPPETGDDDPGGDDEEPTGRPATTPGDAPMSGPGVVTLAGP